jgi:hypothetical protein
VEQEAVYAVHWDNGMNLGVEEGAWGYVAGSMLECVVVEGALVRTSALEMVLEVQIIFVVLEQLQRLGDVKMGQK